MTTTSSVSDGPFTSASNAAVATNAVTVKIPPFWPLDPELSFAQVEAQVSLKQITAQSTKCLDVVAALSPMAATEVRAIILSPPTTNSFDVLKVSLTERMSKRGKIQQFLNGEELGDGEPSQLFRRLQRLYGNCHGDLLQELFLQQLPSNVQVGLLSHPEKPMIN